jgi:Fusaric acid resistance protein-like
MASDVSYGVRLRSFLEQELAPYAGRGTLVARMVIASTAMMLLTMIFRMPFGSHGAIYTFFISRQSLRSTTNAVLTIVTIFSASAMFVLIGSIVSVGDPVLRLPWVVAALFVIFFLLSAMPDYVASSGFGVVVVSTLSLWDEAISTQVKVENTLWILGQTILACLAVLAVELAFKASTPEKASSDQRSGWFRPDALTNPDHVTFALKGCLAASLCYVIYTAVNWPGISTAVVTCLVTALPTLGASQRKQMLRLEGAVAGGLLAIGAQVFILPYIDSIGAFTLLFVAVTAGAAWIATSSPRLSYFGAQLALAFYVVHLQEFAMQTSLAAARDRIVGVLLGIIVMWIVFDRQIATSALTRRPA